MKLKLFLEDFDPSIGKVSYAVEDENGDRVARAEHTHPRLKNYNPATMDFFILGFLPRLNQLGASLSVQGPVSNSLLEFLDADVTPGFEVEGSGREYSKEDVEFFEKVYHKTHDLNKTLSGVFNYYE